MSHKPRQLSARQRAVLENFKLGMPSANPGGRPALRRVSEAYHIALQEPGPNGDSMLLVIARKVVQLAAEGHLPAVVELTDRTEGRAALPISVRTPIDYSQAMAKFDAMSDEELISFVDECTVVLRNNPRPPKVQ